MKKRITDPNDPVTDFDAGQSAYQNIGLTKREYFAAMFMHSLIVTRKSFINKEIITEDSALSVIAADILIVELSKE